jgi:predicted enzyme related to lactoylglutathione lyase
MSERNGYEPGVPCWVDHSSPDPASAASFYGELFGWESEDQMPPGGPGQYFSAQLRGKRVAAMGSQQNPEAPPMWNTYVAVESADETVKKVGEAGGTAYGEAFDVFTAGRMAVADPAGAMFCLWQAGEHHGAQLVNEPGALCWNELTTRDPEHSKPFYASAFGWRTSAIDMGEFEYTLWHAPGAGEPSGEEVIGGMMPMVGDA